MATPYQYPQICDYSCQHYVVSSKRGDHCRVDGHATNSGINCRHYREERDLVDVSDKIEMIDGMPPGMVITHTLKMDVQKPGVLDRLMRAIGRRRPGNLDDTI